MKNTRLIAIIMSICVCVHPVTAVIIDDGQNLHVPAGETYTLGGSQTYRQSVLIEGTLYVAPYDGSDDTGILKLNAPEITVSGSLDGVGRGYRGQQTYNEGPGIGDYPGGGGGYGGPGGNSSYGGTGGTVYGTADSNDIDMGSAGADGSGSFYGGGSGGAAIILRAGSSVQISGTLKVDGGNGSNPFWGAGGGSGGGVLIESPTVNLSGTVSANGGNGNASTWNGGGGGGGRIKIFYGTFDDTGSTVTYEGGTAGGGTAQPGQPGTYVTQQTVLDTQDSLYVPAGFTYSMCGTNSYHVRIQIDGQVTICPYDGTDNTGMLELAAPEIIISGTIHGDGRGYRGDLENKGPGAGNLGSGAGYGGAGGDSGYGGIGGPAYGTETGGEIQMGSGGGDADSNSGGGSGGAMIILRADTVSIEGTVTANGSAGAAPTERPAGGGSGGGILLLVDQAAITGTLSAEGGAGGSTETAYGGGGGAGGRIKIFANSLDSTEAAILYDSGPGGTGATPGQAGSEGIFYTGRHLTGDLNHNGIVDFADLAILSSHWLETL